MNHGLLPVDCLTESCLWSFAGNFKVAGLAPNKKYLTEAMNGSWAINWDRIDVSFSYHAGRRYRYVCFNRARVFSRVVGVEHAIDINIRKNNNHFGIVLSWPMIVGIAGSWAEGLSMQTRHNLQWWCEKWLASGRSHGHTSIGRLHT